MMLLGWKKAQDQAMNGLQLQIAFEEEQNNPKRTG